MFEQLALGIAIDAHFYWCNMINDVIYMLLTFSAIISLTHTHTHTHIRPINKDGEERQIKWKYIIKMRKATTRLLGAIARVLASFG